MSDDPREILAWLHNRVAFALEERGRTSCEAREYLLELLRQTAGALAETSMTRTRIIQVVRAATRGGR